MPKLRESTELATKLAAGGGLMCAALLAAVAFAAGEAGIRGFFSEHAAHEAAIERAFRAGPTPERAREDLRILTESPHVAGTPEDRKTAEFVLGEFRRAGLEAAIVEYRVLLPMPREVRVDMLEPVKRDGPTPEGGAGPGASNPRLVAAFNAFSPSGDVTARVVYANYGLPEDYAVLQQQDIDVSGKIVLVRYGKCFRGVKEHVAEQHHAAAVLIYSDPADDGYREGDVYPGGPWRPATSVQRGSILSLTDYSGDPLTHGVAATAEAARLSIDKTSLPQLPTTPLSYQDASAILENVTGAVAPRDWQGALPITYHLGPGAAKVHVKLDMDFSVRPIWDVIAKIPGASQPDELVVLGNHRDAWAYGAADPASGTAPLLAVARGFGKLISGGWRPERSLILASWDAEEFGLMGSTEWAEEHAKELASHGVAYLNIDVGVCGPHFGASAVPSLGRLVREVAEEVIDPKSGRAVAEVWEDESRSTRGADTHADVAVLDGSADATARVGMLGSGSDYTPFLQHLGVPALDVGFGGPYGVYHSMYDDFYWMQHFGDPTFRYSVAAAQVFGTLGLRLADADALPFDYETYGRAIEIYISDLEADVRRAGAAGEFNFAPARQAAHGFASAAADLDRRLQEAETAGQAPAEALAAVNRDLVKVEKDFLLEGGLPGRAWYRHAFFAPGVYTGYSAVLLPGVREAVERRDWAGAREQMARVLNAVERATATLEDASRALHPAGDREESRPARSTTP